MPTLVCVSDTHGGHDRLTLPPGDILLHAGDFTHRGRPPEVAAFDAWLAGLPYRHKVVIAGNHDFLFERDPALARTLLRNAVYLQDSDVTLAGLTIYGSPWQPRFCDWAFNLDRGPDLAAKWALIPPGTHVLVTHGPPVGILDRTKHGDVAGCADLLARVREVRPRVHLFGHIHEAAGIEQVGETLFVNASVPAGEGRVFVVEIDERGERAELVG